MLSHPFSGALHWWFIQQSDTSDDLRSTQPRHGYYRTLYGDVENNIDVALTASVVFEEIVLPAADSPYPGFEADAGAGLKHPELGFEANWDFPREAQELLNTAEAELLEDPTITALTLGMEPEERRQTLLFATTDVLLADAFEAPVLCAAGRREMVSRLIELGVAPVSPAVNDLLRRSGGLTVGLEDYADVVGLTLTSRTTDALAEIKLNDNIRRYAEGFQAALKGESSGTDLFERVASAWDSADLRTDIGGAFSAASRVLGVAGLIPGVGTITGAASMGADVAGEVARRRAEEFRWYELGPEILRFEALRDLEGELRRRRLR